MNVRMVMAGLLAGGIFAFKISAMAVEPGVVRVPAGMTLNMEKDMSSDTEQILIEDYAAPHWNMSNAEAWQAYNNHQLTIEELIPDEHYILRYSAGSLEVLLSEGD